MGLEARGYAVFDPDPSLAAWAEAVSGPARSAVSDPALRAQWLRHGGTWFAGVDALPNDPQGAVAGSGPLVGAAVQAALTHMGGTPAKWHPAQVSVVYPGYPKQDPNESEDAHRFRLMRDAAHVDGLLPVGAGRRRMLREPHGCVLGVPLNAVDAGASPLVVWKGSHMVMGAAFAAALADIAPEDWGKVDMTACYAAARKHCFETCERITLPLRLGQASLLHRHMLHGIAPWEAAAKAPPEGRMIAYFRPEVARWSDWLDL